MVVTTFFEYERCKVLLKLQLQFYTRSIFKLELFSIECHKTKTKSSQKPVTTMKNISKRTVRTLRDNRNMAEWRWLEFHGLFTERSWQENANLDFIPTTSTPDWKPLQFYTWLPKSIPSETFPLATESNMAPLPFSQAWKNERGNHEAWRHNENFVPD